MARPFTDHTGEIRDGGEDGEAAGAAEQCAETSCLQEEVGAAFYHFAATVEEEEKDTPRVQSMDRTVRKAAHRTPYH